MVEQIGSGIGRMKDAMQTAGLPAPKFKTDGIFTVIFNRGKSSGKNWIQAKEALQQKSTVKLSKSAMKILEMVFHSKGTSIPEMAKKLNPHYSR